ncbi:DUF302 domain-containing protein [Aliiruegeria sabulilitoris]|uniref:DUF302 domain-containing protein n=1 Tax=Aliiruegeria sabulilitoris TaxID=1510458 RepID=UPI00082FD05E|nr:DUF302 domain-containing protein [Aliiruegeria sabulilitoris]NDR58097.1 DUF302 domain-containing protein [Pseudoruegeria sp. M32A2M]
MKKLLAAAVLVSSPAFAQDMVLTEFDGSFDDATFAVESAIVGQGLVIDYVSHTGEMLARTAADVGSDVKIFEAADIFLFCSAKVSREVMEADPMNIVHCPYTVYVIEKDGKVEVGHRSYPDGPMQQVEELLSGIVAEAAGE